RVVVPNTSGRTSRRARIKLAPTKPLAPSIKIGPCRRRIFSAIEVIDPDTSTAIRLSARCGDGTTPISIVPLFEELKYRCRVDPALWRVKPRRAVPSRQIASSCPRGESRWSLTRGKQGRRQVLGNTTLQSVLFDDEQSLRPGQVGLKRLRYLADRQF